MPLRERYVPLLLSGHLTDTAGIVGTAEDVVVANAVLEPEAVPEAVPDAVAE